MNILDEEKVMSMLPVLNETQRRWYLATEAKSLGFGGISALSKLTGVAENTIAVGMKEIKNGVEPSPVEFARKAGDENQ
jgi:hypothetical protein